MLREYREVISETETEGYLDRVQREAIQRPEGQPIQSLKPIIQKQRRRPDQKFSQKLKPETQAEEKTNSESQAATQKQTPCPRPSKRPNASPRRRPMLPMLPPSPRHDTSESGRPVSAVA